MRHVVQQTQRVRALVVSPLLPRPWAGRGARVWQLPMRDGPSLRHDGRVHVVSHQPWTLAAASAVVAAAAAAAAVGANRLVGPSTGTHRCESLSPTPVRAHSRWEAPANAPAAWTESPDAVAALAPHAPQAAGLPPWLSCPSCSSYGGCLTWVSARAVEEPMQPRRACQPPRVCLDLGQTIGRHAEQPPQTPGAGAGPHVRRAGVVCPLMCGSCVAGRTWAGRRDRVSANGGEAACASICQRHACDQHGRVQQQQQQLQQQPAPPWLKSAWAGQRQGDEWMLLMLLLLLLLWSSVEQGVPVSEWRLVQGVGSFGQWLTLGAGGLWIAVLHCAHYAALPSCDSSGSQRVLAPQRWWAQLALGQGQGAATCQAHAPIAAQTSRCSLETGLPTPHTCHW